MQVIPIPCSFDNYSYLLICNTTGDAAVIDPTEAYQVLSQVEKSDCRLRMILCTHHHQDHVGDIGEILKHCPDIEVVCHTSDRHRIEGSNCFVEDGMLITLGKNSGQALFTPGHTGTSVCYHFNDVLFTGDTLFGAGCGRLFEGTAEQMYASLNRKIASLPHDTRLFFGHEYTVKNLQFALSVEPGNENSQNRLERLNSKGQVSTPSSLELELLTNPFLRCDSKEIHENLQSRGLIESIDPLAVFTALRKLRDSF